MSKTIKIRKGVNIKLQGEAEKVHGNASNAATYAVKPSDFPGLIPKMTVKAGDKVKAGTTIFHDKYNEQIKFASPVSGEVKEVVRGAKRRILSVVISADAEIQYETNSSNTGDLSAENVKNVLLGSGLWPLIKSRPYDVVANPADTPKAIFISAFDSNPLAVDYDFVAHGNGDTFQKGLDVLSTLAKVNLTVNAASKASKVFTNSKNVTINNISGPHPAGNVGVQIHHIDPINKGESVWTLTPSDVLTIGRYFETGQYDVSKIIAVAGTGVEKPRYYKVIAGCDVSNVLADAGIKEGQRVISGNVLTGDKIEANGHLGYYANQLTVITEGNEPQFMGWLAPNFHKFSISRTFFSWLTPNKQYDLNTNLNGEERAFVVTGQYESVMPMDIYPVHLIKAMMIGDVDAMEQLGIYEVAPEDFALCEYVCTSKIEAQSIVREALDFVKKEMS